MTNKRVLLLRFIFWGIAGAIFIYIIFQCFVTFHLINRDYNRVIDVIDKHQEFSNLAVQNYGNKGVIVTGGLPNQNLINQFKDLVKESNCNHVKFVV